MNYKPNPHIELEFQPFLAVGQKKTGIVVFRKLQNDAPVDRLSQSPLYLHFMSHSSLKCMCVCVCVYVRESVLRSIILKFTEDDSSLKCMCVCVCVCMYVRKSVFGSIILKFTEDDYTW